MGDTDIIPCRTVVSASAQSRFGNRSPLYSMAPRASTPLSPASPLNIAHPLAHTLRVLADEQKNKHKRARIIIFASDI